jgi:hypothetical protein
MMEIWLNYHGLPASFADLKRKEKEEYLRSTGRDLLLAGFLAYEARREFEDSHTHFSRIVPKFTIKQQRNRQLMIASWHEFSCHKWFNPTKDGYFDSTSWSPNKHPIAQKLIDQIHEAVKAKYGEWIPHQK